MGSTLLGITAVIYAAVALDYLTKGNGGMALAFLAYAVANVGFILAGVGLR